MNHLIHVELIPGHSPDLGENVSGLIAIMALAEGCSRYTRGPHPIDANTWLIQGGWDCSDAMFEHFKSGAMQSLLTQLRALSAYRVRHSYHVEG